MCGTKARHIRNTAGQVRADNEVPLVKREIRDVLADIDAGVVDEDLDLAKPACDFGFKLRDIVLIGDVGFEYLRETTVGFDLGRDTIQLFHIAGNERDSRSRIGESECHRLA